MKIILSSNPAALTAALADFDSTATVEAEYGDALVAGSVLTFAHHGPRAGQPCPCSYGNDVADGKWIEAIGVSHVDLDTLGGVLAIQGRKPEAPTFWALAEYMDLNGAHKLALSGASAEDVSRLHAFWAWSEANRLYAPRDGSVVEANAWIDAACVAITAIIAGDADHLAAGAAHKAAGEALNAASFVRRVGGVILRQAEGFVNHLYATPDGEPAQAVVAFNTKTGAVTVSFADARPQDDARAFVQSLWGAEAGGHKGIAGSPRDVAMSFADAEAAAEKLAALLA